MKYIDVILPLPIDSLFTYAADDSTAAGLQPGMRVLVPLGRSKTYTAVVFSEPADEPHVKEAGGKSIEYRKIMGVQDKAPILLPQQIRLWKWIADYYMAAPGDVMKAALPSGLKAEDGYRPRTELYIRLTEKFNNRQSLHIAFDILGRAEKQKDTLTAYLKLSHQDCTEDGTTTDTICEVTREELMNTAHATIASIKGLCDKGILETYKKEVGRLNKSGKYQPEHIRLLNDAQTEAYNKILMQMMGKNVVLLHGVTSSGKTEIYIHLIEKAIEDHKQVLYLLPEIALTVQMTERLQRVFGDRMGIYHSKYSDNERVEIWRKQLSGNPYDVILGARSAVFLPFQKLGLVIIDEEHVASFKQQEPAPRYHARSAAIVLARMYGAKVLLGTATPSMESYYNTETGKYGLVTLSQRYKGLQLPDIEVVDTKDLRHRKMMKGAFSPQLLDAIGKALEDGKQAILFQNRRGFAPTIECQDCGWVPKCDNCDVSLTYHKNMNQLTCHYCGFTYSVPKVCPNCGSTRLRDYGFGTEKIEDYVRETFPKARVARMDLDTTHTRLAYERIIDDFSSGKTDILIGTQMVTKGLDFDNVEVVGILDADSMLNYPDFRAYEQAFMMMAQVSGRAGRKGGQGKVLLQTKSPQLPVISQVVNHDFEGFYRSQLTERKAFHYPPYYRLIYVYLKHRKESVADTAAIEMGSLLRQWFGDRVLGPDKPSVARVKTLSIRKIILKLENNIDQKRVRQYLKLAQQRIMSDKQYATLQIYFDVDPM